MYFWEKHNIQQMINMLVSGLTKIFNFVSQVFRYLVKITKQIYRPTSHEPRMYEHRNELEYTAYRYFSPVKSTHTSGLILTAHGPTDRLH